MTVRETSFPEIRLRNNYSYDFSFSTLWLLSRPSTHSTRAPDRPSPHGYVLSGRGPETHRYTLYDVQALTLRVVGETSPSLSPVFLPPHPGSAFKTARIRPVFVSVPAVPRRPRPVTRGGSPTVPVCPGPVHPTPGPTAGSSRLGRGWPTGEGRGNAFRVRVRRE